jgi:hypothetical protein
MSKTIKNEGVMNNSNPSTENEFNKLTNEINGLNTEREKFTNTIDEKIQILSEKKKELIRTSIPLNKGDKVITKGEHTVYSVDKRKSRGIGKEIGKVRIKGEIWNISEGYEIGECFISIKLDLDKKLVSELDLIDNLRGGNNTNFLSLEVFNELYQTIKD